MYDAALIEKPFMFRIAPLKQGRSKRKPYIIGFDSEAGYHRPGDGKPFLFQFSLPDTTEQETMLVTVDDQPGAAFARFMEFVARRCTDARYEFLIYGFNLQYEWTQLFGDVDDDWKSQSEVIQPVSISLDGHESEWEWHIYNDKRVFAVIRNVRRKYIVRLLDAQMFYTTSLDKAAKVLGLGEKIDTIDRETIWRGMITDPTFLEYARRDAFITRKLGEHIVNMHEQYNVTQTISAPHFASKVFRRHFLSAEIPLPEVELEQRGLWSYHGGKNGYYLDGPAHIENAWQYDITSAYPEAMRQLPDPEQSQWQRVSDYVPGRHAIYEISGEYTRCRYRGAMLHDGSWPESGHREAWCVTSYELDAMIERGEFRIDQLFGWEMVGPTGGPLVRYVDEFFALKARSAGAERETAKLFLNSLYGKFFQKVALGVVGYFDVELGQIIEHNPEGPYDWRAGGLYHPPIASLITGFVRAKIHRLEHRYNAIMTSTDGLFALHAPDPSDVGVTLGALTAGIGDLKIWRERLYIFRPSDGGKPKVAFHGFWGTLDQLDAMPLAAGEYEYGYRHMVTLKESLKRFSGAQYGAGTFAELSRKITIDGSAAHH